MSQKDVEQHLEKIKEKIESYNELTEEEKSNAWKHIEQWYAEDKAWGTFLSELANISPKIESLLAEIGLI